MVFSQDDKGSEPGKSEPYPQQPYPGQQYPEQQYPQQPVPDQQYPQQQYPAQPYSGQPYPQQPPYPNRTNTLAIASLVLSILGWTFAPLVASIGGVVCGHIARKQIRRTGENGAGMALAGIVVGYVSIVFFVLAAAAIILFVVFASVDTTSTY